MKFDDASIKAANMMLPAVDSLETLLAKGKLVTVLNEYKLKLAKVDPEEFKLWSKDPEKFVCNHDPKQYEEIVSVGYHPEDRQLAAVIHVKLPYGYGGPCPKAIGSTQYVRFYVNWTGDGDFTDLDEDQEVAKVHLFDPDSENEKKLPLEYAVKKAIDFPEKRLKLLENECTVVRVRAILSWNVSPPSRSPNWRPFWGNVFETKIRFHR